MRVALYPLQALTPPQGATKPLRWDKAAIETWETGLLLEKTLAVLHAPSPCHPLHRLELGKPAPCKSQSQRSEPERWKGSCGTDWCLVQRWTTFQRHILKSSHLPEPHSKTTSTEDQSRARYAAARHRNCLPKMALPPQTLQGPLPFRDALGSALLNASVNIYSSPGSPVCVLLPFPWVGAHVTAPYSENSVAQCRRSGSCAFTSPQRDDLVGMSLNKALEYFK